VPLPRSRNPNAASALSPPAGQVAAAGTCRAIAHTNPASSRATATAALRKLYEGLFVTRDANNRYRIVADAGIGKDDARREVLRRIVASLGVVSAEVLAACTLYEYSMAEIRQRLRAFEKEGWLTKGFLARGERTLMWAIQRDLPRIGQVAFRRKFVLTPMDNFFLYVREAVAKKFRMGSCFVVFDGPEMVAAFTAKRRKTSLAITKFEGDAEARQILVRFKEENEIEVGEHVDRISDAEVMEWYTKMYGRGASK